MDHGAAVGADNLRLFESKLATAVELMASGMKLGVATYPSLLWSLYTMNRLSRACLESVRKKMSWCSEYCESGACLAKIYQYVTRIRDNYLQITQNFGHQLPLPPFLKDKLATSLEDWDDLAEDCYLGMDKEVRSLLNRIADAVQNPSYANV